MGDEAVVEVTMDTGQIINAVAAVGGAARSQFPDIGFGLDHLAGGEIVLHVQADVVARNLFAPGLAEGGRAVAVREDDDIALMGHQAVVPAVGPALRQGALRTAQADLDGGIFLGRIELWRIKDPGEHLAAVGGRDHPGLGLVLVQLVQDAGVLEGQLMDGVVIDSDQFGREIHGAVGRQEGSVLQHGERGSEVEPQARGGEADEGRLRSGNHVEDALDTLHEGIEVEGLPVGRPDRAVGIVVKPGGQVPDVLDGRIGGLPLPFRRINDIGQHQADLVGLVAVTGHGEPGDLAAVGAPDGDGVVAAGHRDDGGLAGEDAVDVDLGVGGEGILLPRLFLAGVGDVTAVRAPGEILDAAVRGVREVERDVGPAQDVQAFGDDAVRERGDEGMVQVGGPVVPVAVHQVLGGIGVGLVQRRIGIRGTPDGARDGAHEHELGAVRGEGELIDTARDVSDLGALAELPGLVGGLPDLAALEEIDGVAFRGPAGVRKALSVHRKLRGIAAAHGDGEEVTDAAVVRDAGVTHPVKDGLSVGGKLGVAEASQGKEDLRGHPAVGDLDVGGADVAWLRFHLFLLIAREGRKGGHREG